MNELNWLLYTSIAVWLGLGLYVSFVARAQRALNRRLTQLETLHND